MKHSWRPSVYFGLDLSNMFHGTIKKFSSLVFTCSAKITEQSPQNAFNTKKPLVEQPQGGAVM